LAQASFDYANSRQNIQTSASPTFNALTLTNALTIAQGGTGATSAPAALNNLLPSGTTSGYVLTTGGPGTFYWAAGGGGGSGATPGTTINSSRLSYTANGSGFSYTTPKYTPGASQLRVYFDGLRQFASEYTETSNTICTFSSAPASGVVVLFEVDGYVNNPYYANNIPFTINSTISPTANTIQQAIDGLASKVAYTSGATFTNTIQTPSLIATSNVGIGTSSPQSKLSVYGTAGTANITMSDETLGATYGGQIRGYGVGGVGGIAELGVIDAGTYSKGFLVGQQANFVALYTGASPGASSERMRIDSVGRTTVPYQPYSWVRFGFTSTATAWQKMVGSTTVTSIGGHWDTVNNKFTCPTAGRYMVMMGGYSSTAGTANERYALGVYKNGTLLQFNGGSLSAGDSPLSASVFVFDLAANDYLECWAFTANVMTFSNSSNHSLYAQIYLVG
jgi:hypothetical protein